MILYMTEIAVAHFDEALAWFRDVMGLEVALLDQPRQFALLGREGGRIGLTALKANSTAPLPRLTFLVDDLFATAQRLREVGVIITEIVEDHAERFRSFRLEGPEGIPITVFSWS